MLFEVDPQLFLQGCIGTFGGMCSHFLKLHDTFIWTFMLSLLTPSNYHWVAWTFHRFGNIISNVFNVTEVLVGWFSGWISLVCSQLLTCHAWWGDLNSLLFVCLSHDLSPIFVELSNPNNLLWPTYSIIHWTTHWQKW